MSVPDRRTVLRSGLAAAALGAVGAATGCTARPASSPARHHLIGPRSPQVAAAEAARHATGTALAGVAPQPGHIDLGGPVVATWSYGGQVPGPEIRVRAGQTLRALLVNGLPAATTVHWHGVAIRNDMDGVPGMTQAPVPPGREYTYSFTVAEPGTYWYHPHVGVQLDRGLYGPLIVEDPAEPGGYDHDWTVVLDDWIDGTGYTPDQVLDALRNGMGGMSMAAASPSPMATGMSGMPMPGDSPSMSMSTPAASPSPAMSGMGGMSSGPTGPNPVLSGARSALLGGDAGDVRYPGYLINGRIRTAPRTFIARAGQRARIRFINAGADTAFRVALGGHQMTVTHTDGYPVAPVRADALLIGMGERYDVQVILGDGVFPLTALAEGKNATALALIRTGLGEKPPASIRPAELNGRLARYGVLHAAPSARLAARKPDVTYRLRLTGGMARYDWGINGQAFDMSRPGALQFLMAEGQRVRVIFANTTTMYHPMHIHGHTFQLGPAGPRKDTVIVRPGQHVACDFDAANPGQWMTHCHNLYHAPQGGMMAMLSYQT